VATAAFAGEATIGGWEATEGGFASRQQLTPSNPKGVLLLTPSGLEGVSLATTLLSEATPQGHRTGAEGVAAYP